MGGLVLDSVIVCLLRITLFFGCQKYLLRTLYHDLLDATGGEVIDIGDEGEELVELPQHTGANAKPEREPRDHFHSTLARATFSTCFGESITLFALLMFQGLDILDVGSRMANWKFSLAVILLNITIFIPYSFSLVLTYRRSANDSRPQRRSFAIRCILTVLPVSFFLFILSYVPLPSSISETSGISGVVSRLTVIGTVILGLLSGFGSINNAWDYLPILSQSQKVPTDNDVSTAEQALARVRKDLADRRADQHRRGSSHNSPGVGWLSKVAVNFRGGSESSALALELQGLEALEYQMSKGLDVLKERRENARFATTLKGRIFSIMGHGFAIYCVFRIISSVANLVGPVRSNDSTSTSSDMVTQLLVYGVSLFPSINLQKEEVASVARQVSLVLIGAIILSSLRQLMSGVLRVTNRNLGASMMLLLLAQIMGIYLLSTLIQLRTSFPSSDTEENLFKTLPEYVVFGGSFDGSFLVAVVLSGFARWVDDKINK
ncbi:Abscisic acid G-protein coupled receptor-domain-containing protein [Thelephora terrestris]|uniref:Abscisic acid G-protein coupled receptor-domain-containing protein n=1 Tax=Thelephora terrestris TaxID=56493 RepID=A0A9P6LBX9_9AGAM|nr:Abscisic acid G-protein coupled receptor-domain-containing protein [Thelephora terrestris]